MKEQQGLPASGQQLHHFSNYDLIRRIDVGGMGEVYLAYQRTAFNRKVAVKIIRSDLVHDATARKRFLREAEVSAHLKHDHILPMFEFGEEQGRLFIVTPYIEGGTLSRRLQSGPLSLLEAHQLFIALAQAVSYIHKRGVIHRDLKPGNILLDNTDNSEQVYVRLIDFGIASLQGKAASPQMTIGGQEMGTLAYLAPERLNGIAAPSNDIYSLGVILYQMLTGDIPSVSSSLVLPPALDTVIQRSTASNPAERYSTVDELIKAFEGTYRYLSSTHSVDIPVTERADSVEVDDSPTPGRVINTPQPVDTYMEPFSTSEPVTGAQAPITARQISSTPAQTRGVRQNTGSRPALRQPGPLQSPAKNSASKTNSSEMPSLPLRQTTSPRTSSVRANSAEFPVIQSEPNSLKRAGMLVHTQDQEAFTRKDYDAPTSSLIFPPTSSSTPSSKEEAKGTKTSGVQPVKKPPAMSKARRRSLLALIPVSILVLLLVVGGLSYLIYQASINATISVTPKVQEISQIFTLKAVPNSTNSNDDTVIQANVITLNQSGTLHGGTSGRTGCTLGIFDCQQAVSPYDVSFLEAQLRPGLQKQLLDQIQNLANHKGEQLVGAPVFNDSTIASTPDVGSQAKSVSVSLTEQGSAEYFVKNDAQQQAGKLLQKLVAQKFGASYQLMDKYTQLSQASVRSIDTNGVITINIAAIGIASYQISDSEMSMMKSQVEGRTQKNAQTYISKQAGINPSSVIVNIYAGKTIVTSAGQIIPMDEGRITINPVEPNILSLPTLKLPKLDPGMIFNANS
jgi:serine/threonine protein kinase